MPPNVYPVTVTALLVPTLALLNVAVAVPASVTFAWSAVSTPTSVAVPPSVAVRLASYSLLLAVTPVIVNPNAVTVLETVATLTV